MSFSKAKLKRFNDVDICDSPSAAGATQVATGTVLTPSSTAHPERKELIEKFFKDAVRANGASASAKEPKEGKEKEKSSLKAKGLRLFRTPSLPHRLRFRQNSDLASSATASSTPLQSTSSTPIKEIPKSVTNLKGKEALQFEIRAKNELLDNYASQIDVLKRHVDQLKESEVRFKEENAQFLEKNEVVLSELIEEKSNHKNTIECMGLEKSDLLKKSSQLETEIKILIESHASEINHIKSVNSQLQTKCEDLNKKYDEQLQDNCSLKEQIQCLQTEIAQLQEKLDSSESVRAQNLQEAVIIQSKNTELLEEVAKLKAQIENDALAYAAEAKGTFIELESLRNEKNALKNDLANKSDLIQSLKDEITDKNCEIDSHCDTIRVLEEEKSRISSFEHSIENAEEKVRIAEIQAEQKIKELEASLQKAVDQERNYWRVELTKRQHQAENQVIKVELEKQDVMVLLESTNDMLRERDEKIQKYEEQLRKGLDYYIQLTDNLQKQVVDLKADIAKTITEKYNYQLTLSNTRSTVNILMERLKKSDSDVETLKSELDAVQVDKEKLESSYSELQNELSALKGELTESEKNLTALRESSTALQNEVRAKETMFSAMLTSEEETLGKFNKIANTFQERIDENVEKYVEMYMDLKNKDENREVYMADMRKALDEFATVLELAQLEIDNKDKCLTKLREENEELKLQNISLKSKSNENSKCVAEKDTDSHKYEEILIDSHLRAECDKITNWLLSTSDDSNEVKDMLKEKITGTPKSLPRTPKACQNTTPKTPRTPRTPRTPKSLKTALFTGKENLVPGVEVTKSPLKTRNK